MHDLPTYLFDSHCHTTYIDLDIYTIVNKCKQNNVLGIWSMSVVENDFKTIIQHAIQTDMFVTPFLGIDPEVFIPGSSEFLGLQNTYPLIESWVGSIIYNIQQYSNIHFGIGEIGLDMYWLRKNKCGQSVVEASINAQRLLFRRMLEIVKDFNLPVSIHSRGFERETFEVVKEYNLSSIVVFHSFTGSYDVAKDIIDAGYFIGVNGIVTYESGKNVLNMMRKFVSNSISTPFDLYKQQILIETDSPYLPLQKDVLFNTPNFTRDIFDYFCNF